MTENDVLPINSTPPENARKKKATVAVIVLLVVFILAVVSMILVKELVVASFVVDGISMYPTLDGGAGANPDTDAENGDVLYLNKTAKIKRGDIVVFRPEWDGTDKALVKRVVALGGDTLAIKDNKVYVNGALLDEPYVNGDMITPDIELEIPSGHAFMMGDNRNNSDDCRRYGAVSLDKIVGRCFLIKGTDGKLRTP